jgi:hypothetical protein
MNKFTRGMAIALIIILVLSMLSSLIVPFL